MHGSSFLQVQGMAGEAVVCHCETRHNAADVRRWDRP